MPGNPEPPPSLNVGCPHCHRDFRMDPQEIMASYVLGYLNGELQRLLGRHEQRLNEILTQGLQPLAKGKAIDRLRDQLEESNKQRAQLEQQRDELRRARDELAERLAEKISERTSVRTDVGRTVHTSHRQLADQVAGLLGRVNAVARERAAADGMTGPVGWLRSDAAALIFRLLFTPEKVSREEHDRWAGFTRDTPSARSLAGEGSDLARAIRETAGYQKWIWDFAPKGTPFDPGLHEVWQNCDPSGEVQFVVIPAYLVDFAVIAKPKVFTSWADH